MVPPITVYDQANLLGWIELESSYVELYAQFMIATPKPMADIGWGDILEAKEKVFSLYANPFGFIWNRVNECSVHPTIYLRLKTTVPLLHVMAVVVHSYWGWSIIHYESQIARDFEYEGHGSLTSAVHAVHRSLEVVRSAG
ncbi:MAG: hypothetical protein E1N59_2590 [Puniceicoccaceae bacterium 5H]|nr:MAG: hypothetical protein E1N59_2590 [Puniceicoccaceae bacterium 5H]